jgi:predicted DNA-binding ribbon-helix-helix protein
MRKRSISIHGHATSISLEDEFWQELAGLARQRKLSMNALVTEIDKQRSGQRTGQKGDAANLSSTLRVYVLKQCKRKISRA